jgi:hypothetical protein
MTPDPRALAACDRHCNAAVFDGLARAERRRRDELVWELHTENPRAWSLAVLAEAVGCSKELVAHIVRERRKREQGDGACPAA